jgi:hypothetical protein
MTKEKKSVQAVPAMPAPVPALSEPLELKSVKAEPARLQEVDRMALELAKSRRQTALAEAKTALANNENAELAYKYIVLQLYMKYGLTDRDAISEAGEIIKDGAVQQQQPQGQ